MVINNFCESFLIIKETYGRMRDVHKPASRKNPWFWKTETRAGLWGTASTFNKCLFFTLSNKFQIPVNFVFIYFSNTG